MIPAFVFMGTIAYAVLGNFAVYVILVSRKVSLRFGYAGLPFYLYRVCVEASPAMPRLRAFALSTDIALLLAPRAWIWASIGHP